MTYNELAQVLETKNPKTGKLYTLKDMNVITMESAGTAMLEDGIYARGDWLRTRRTRTSRSGSWRRRSRAGHSAATTQRRAPASSSRQGPTLGAGHQTWQMNEINKLIWPAPLRHRRDEPGRVRRGRPRSRQQFKVIKKPAPSAPIAPTCPRRRSRRSRKQGVNVTGKEWKPIVVKVTAGGK